MEKLTNTQLLERDALVRESFAEKKGRESFGPNPFTCYISIDSPCPNLAHLTASLLEELAEKSTEAFLWAKQWDKSIIAIAPNKKLGCLLLPGADSKGKLFVPVSTTKVIETKELVASLPEGELALLGINDQPMTIDAFLVSYFHMVNELIWDMAISESQSGAATPESYSQALGLMLKGGFSVGLVSEREMVEVKKTNPSSSIRIYGSQVNKYVPEMMGVVIK